MKVAIPVVPTIRVIATFTKFEEVQPITEEFCTPPSTPEKLSPDHVQPSDTAITRLLHPPTVPPPPASSSSWMQWIKVPKVPYRQNNSTASSVPAGPKNGSSSRMEDPQDPFLIPADYTWITPEAKKKKMQEKKKNNKSKKIKSQQNH